tara:strand:- start:3177 stop:4544 length:1368 start_codon:yes stop_codon:yes gene_type:complete
MNLNKLTAISSVDGRYRHVSELLSPYFSEFALMKYRLLIEIEWFILLSSIKGVKELIALNKRDVNFLRSIYLNFDLKEAQKIKKLESRTNHDVKAVEYYLRNKFTEKPKLSKSEEFIHFACTSEDINNLAYSLMLKDACQDILIPSIKSIRKVLKDKSRSYSSVAMLSRTHGQSASPTTMGKEFANFVYRIDGLLSSISKIKLSGKINGAVGNYNAHLVAYPDVDWLKVSNLFVQGLGLNFSLYTTQVEQKDSLAELMHAYVRLNNILLDFSRDAWGYISIGYFKQKLNDGEVGSSTMPHKVNPIDFENAEGNLGISNSMFEHIAHKIVISRWQRDLSDSTVLRNIGSAFSLSLIAYESLKKGIKKLDINKKSIKDDLENSWELLSEAIQTIMRKNKIPHGYEIMKDLSRGKSLDKSKIKLLIESLNIEDNDREILLQLNPSDYIGLASVLAKKV